MKQEPSKLDTRKRDTLRGYTKGLMVGLLIAVVAAVIAYAIGMSLGRAALQERMTALQEDDRNARADLANAQAANGLLQARGALYRAGIDLERRNFGSAADDVRRAGEMLRSVNAEGTPIDAARLKDVTQSVAKTEINVQQDVGTQRERILGLADQVDALVPRTPAAEPAAAPVPGAPPAPSRG